MEHLDPTLLALAALGEELDEDGRRHLRACSQCAAEVTGLSRIAETARSEDAIRLESPEPEVWERVHQDLGLSARLAADPLNFDAGRDSSADADPSAGTDMAGPSGAVSTLGASRTGGGRRGAAAQRSPLWLAAAAAAGILIGGGTVWGISQQAQDRAREVLAETRLEPLPGYESSGKVTVTEGARGLRTLSVTAQEGQAPGYREVWLISEDLKQMYSLGVLAGEEGTFAIPEGVALSQFPIIDISNEPTDGNPEHSGDSVLRGTLPAAAGNVR
ncbi:MAG TPA: anti-sigma factor [Arthrobacter sp.]|nr:anti-sigma factor [Arthrobacter sp.]